MGSPPSEVTALTSTIIEGVDTALDVARPGVTCEAVEAVWQKVLNQAGYHKDSRVGYSVGLNYPPDWGERTASLRPGDQTELQSGMCVHLHSQLRQKTLIQPHLKSLTKPLTESENTCHSLAQFGHPGVG